MSSVAIYVRIVGLAFACLVGLPFVGCSTGMGSSAASADVAPIIVSQPRSISVPMGLAASFGVEAVGLDLRYQWTRNGVAISGATSTFYMSPLTAFADTGEVFAVTISNSAGASVSTPATLTVTARAPKPGDLRFQQVDSVRTVNGFGAVLFGCPGVADAGGCALTDAAGGITPISVVSCGSLSGGCLWQYIELAQPAGVPGIEAGFECSLLSGLQADLGGSFGGNPPDLLKGNSVITSLNFTRNVNSIYGIQDLYGLSWVLDQSVSGFDLAQHTVLVADFAGDVVRDGLNGRVVTAVTYDLGRITYLTYGWSSDIGTAYETKIVAATLATAATAASGLAQQGYILTAMGGEETDGLILVGTRVAGDTMPRPFLSSTSIADLANGGYAPVGAVHYGPGGSTGSVFGER